MGKFNRDDKRSSNNFGRGFGGGNRFGGRPALHKATCSECGDSCDLPFKPTGNRPVFCSNCFKKQGGGNERPNKFAGARHENHSFEDRQTHNAVCDKCGQNCQVPFKPTIGKPVFCNACFKLSGNNNKNSEEIMEQIKLLNDKIDKLLTILTPNILLKKIEKSETNKDSLDKKTVKVKKEKIKTKIAPKKSSTKKKK